MGGWFLDKILVFLIGSLLRDVRELRSWKWSRTKAVVDGAYAPSREYFPYASLTYLYMVDGVKHAGRYERAFYSDWAASDFKSRYPEGKTIAIRVHPKEPDRSYFSEADQTISSTTALPH